jgi:hypothetical protein
MALTKPLASTHPSLPTNATRRLSMARNKTKDPDPYQPLAIDSEALWAVVAVVALTLIMHLVEYH